jgi:hypothetical protein
MANGVAEVLPLQPFPIRVLNTSPRERTLPKGMILGHALPHPKGIVALAEEVRHLGHLREPPGLPCLDGHADLSASPPAAKESEYPLPDRPDVDGELWKEEVDLAHLLPHERERVLRSLAKHRSMWDGRLGHVHTATHRIDLTPGAKPVHAQPYRAGPRAREAEAAEVQRMLEAGVIETASSEWASPVVLGQSRMARCGSVLITGSLIP